MKISKTLDIYGNKSPFGWWFKSNFKFSKTRDKMDTIDTCLVRPKYENRILKQYLKSPKLKTNFLLFSTFSNPNPKYLENIGFTWDLLYPVNESSFFPFLFLGYAFFFCLWSIFPIPPSKAFIHILFKVCSFFFY